VNRHLLALREAGRVVQEGHTRGAVYRLARPRSDHPRVFRRSFRRATAAEDEWFAQADAFLSLRRHLPGNVHAILAYAFLEMLNNAIDHSHSERVRIEVRLSVTGVSFSVRDTGIGVFASIRARYGLADEAEALREVLKGKRTSMPERHSGEGLFFTARVADRFALSSHRLSVEFDNVRKDTAAASIRHHRGTRVEFAIRRTSRRRLENVFHEFAPERHGYRFEKTRVAVKLHPGFYGSRSEARRLLSGLDRFREIELDFREVNTIGQGFADEVFRVFPGRHPASRIRTFNAPPAVAAMIAHVTEPRTDDRSRITDLGLL
jgi:anti-sigma regulatory factor (Ser/Thr protein kinase)